MAGYVHDESEAAMFTRPRELFEALVAGLADPVGPDRAGGQGGGDQRDALLTPEEFTGWVGDALHRHLLGEPGESPARP